MPRTRPPYPPEFRAEAVRLVRESGKTMTEVARNLGVSTESLRHWIRQHEIDNGERNGLTTAEREELRRLRRENASSGRSGKSQKSRRLLRPGDQQQKEVAAFLFVEAGEGQPSPMCRVLGVSTSGYYAWQRRGVSARAQEDAELMERIIQIHRASRGTYGAPRIQAELTLEQGIRCSKKRVARLMRQANLTGVHRRKRHGCTRRDPVRPSYPDLVKWDFTATTPNQLWVADITPHSTDEGWLYLATVIDVFSRIVVGWAMGECSVAGLVVSAVNMAVWNPGQSLA